LGLKRIGVLSGLCHGCAWPEAARLASGVQIAVPVKPAPLLCAATGAPAASIAIVGSGGKFFARLRCRLCRCDGRLAPVHMIHVVAPTMGG